MFDRAAITLGIGPHSSYCFVSSERVCVCALCSELCTELLSQVALTPSFKRWDLGDIERLQRVDTALFNQLPHNSQFSHHCFATYCCVASASYAMDRGRWKKLIKIV